MVDLSDSPSAGVPNNTTFPPNLSSITTSAVASAAPTDATAIKLCPQACPSPVKASIHKKNIQSISPQSAQLIHTTTQSPRGPRKKITHHTQH